MRLYTLILVGSVLGMMPRTALAYYTYQSNYGTTPYQSSNSLDNYANNVRTNDYYDNANRLMQQQQFNTQQYSFSQPNSFAQPSFNANRLGF